MKNKIWLLAIVALTASACRTPLQVAQVQPQKNTSITSEIAENQNFVSVIAPYKAELEKKMNSKISYTSEDLNKSGDNSNLGNLLADFTYEGAEEWGEKNNIETNLLNHYPSFLQLPLHFQKALLQKHVWSKYLLHQS